MKALDLMDLGKDKPNLTVPHWRSNGLGWEAFLRHRIKLATV
jgi:hypothetical protein